MLTRQKIILGLLMRVDAPLSAPSLAWLLFLLRQEPGIKEDAAFYDFVPHGGAPRSFSLEQEVRALRVGDPGWLLPEDDEPRLALRCRDRADAATGRLPVRTLQALRSVLKYAHMPLGQLKESVLERFPACGKVDNVPQALPAVYTAGYQGLSVEAFFERLLKRGIRQVVDVRANPQSRKFGFSYRTFREIARNLGMEYRNIRVLGVPRRFRTELNDNAAYERLWEIYDAEILQAHAREVGELARCMGAHPAVLVCFEEDPGCCHRSRLAERLAGCAPLQVEHLASAC